MGGAARRGTSLSFLRENVHAENRIEALVTRAKLDLEQEAKKPQVNTAPLKAEIRKILDSHNRFASRAFQKSILFVYLFKW